MDELTVGKALLKQMTADKDTLYVIYPLSNHIGDLLVDGGLCHALLKKKRKKACVLIAPEKFSKIDLNFVGVKEVQYIPKTLMELIRRYIYATREYEADNYVFGHFHMKANREDWKAGVEVNRNLPFMHRFKENVFGLPLDTEIIPPIIQKLTDAQKQRLHETYTLDKARTIILAPYANALQNLEPSFWDKLVEKLIDKNKDYVIYTNTAPNEKPIAGTTPIVTTFAELAYVAENINCFIGLRSGIFDFLVLVSPNARLLYTNDARHFSLKSNYNHINSVEFSNEDSSIDKIVEAVI